MAHRVTYLDKSGKLATVTFPSETLATAYARTVKGAKVEPVDVATAAVTVKKCEAGTAEAQREATRHFYAIRGSDEPFRSSYASSEHVAEAYMEAGSQARLCGASTSEALDAAREAANSVH